jgi:hypothetical protein
MGTVVTALQAAHDDRALGQVEVLPFIAGLRLPKRAGRGDNQPIAVTVAIVLQAARSLAIRSSVRCSCTR